ncbi:MAG: sn-glycerol-3-phosphate ABC transporter ATP-binding protein UgpC [Bacteriovoracaceae bacterium]|nr:sn-glycerol-3-phosphate ABC transporter ATP-binding protein UgpC [Bacteriovoracaceae bacterium]
MSNIELKNIKKNYGKTTVIEGLDLSVADGEFVVLVGPSGCGKSTTLRMIAGLEDITGGDLLIDDKLMNLVSPTDRGIAMVFQDYALYPHMTVYENLAFSLRLKKAPKKTIEERITAAAEMLSLTPYLERKPADLSGGQRQRVAMGRAIVKKSNVFLYDEPLSNLDAKLRHKMRTEIKRFHIQAKTTSVYVTHDQLEAMTLGDKLVVMSDGKVEQIGTPLEIYQRPMSKFVATFIGNPTINMFTCEVVKEDDTLLIKEANGVFKFTLPESKQELLSEGMKVSMGIRPSDIFISKKNDHLPPEWRIDGKVDMVELLGKNAFLTMKSNDILFQSEVMGSEFPQIGETKLLSFNLNHIHLFDDATGINLLYK